MQNFITNEILKHAQLKGEAPHNLIKALFDANYEMPHVVRQLRPSYLNFRQVIDWNGKVENAHAASLMALNSDHGCFDDAYKFISKCLANHRQISINCKYLLASNEIIPGFGNPVIKDQDDRCIAICHALNINTSDIIYGNIMYIIETVQNEIRLARGVTLFPNLVFWNAAVIYTLGLPRQYASLIFILATQIAYLNSLFNTNLNE